MILLQELIKAYIYNIICTKENIITKVKFLYYSIMVILFKNFTKKKSKLITISLILIIISNIHCKSDLLSINNFLS